MTQNTIDRPSATQSALDSQGNRLVIQFALAATTILLCVVLIIWGIHRVEVSDPYVHDVLASTGNLERGQQLFWQNCATCHGVKGA
ncbi:MAG: c-type cytochrome, partial [Cyanobacteria bacterium J06636_28]